MNGSLSTHASNVRSGEECLTEFCIATRRFKSLSILLTEAHDALKEA
jgi:hypothetical protein